MVLAVILPKLGVSIGNDELTAWVSTTVVIGAAVVAGMGRSHYHIRQVLPRHIDDPQWESGKFLEVRDIADHT